MSRKTGGRIALYKGINDKGDVIGIQIEKNSGRPIAALNLNHAEALEFENNLGVCITAIWPDAPEQESDRPTEIVGGQAAPFDPTVEALLDQVADLTGKNNRLIERVKDAEKLAWHFARKIDSTHAECVIADARLELMSKEEAPCQKQP